MLLRVLDFWLEGTERAMALMTLLAVSGDGMTSCARQMRPGCRGASTRAAQEEGVRMESLRPSPRPVAFSQPRLR